MPPKEHYLAKYFEKTKEKANKSNVFSVCKFCIKGFSYDVAVVQSKITHKSHDCKNHLKSCQFFLAEYSYEEQQEILNPPDETIESSSTSMKKRRLNLFNKTVDGYFKPNFQGKHLEQYERIRNSFENIIQSATQNNLGVTLSYDSWKNVASRNIIESTLITAEGLALAWNIEDLNNKCKN
ncbi:4678_t:CDS:2 [Cetraspora pellucida]|uniref:4678_t:CDS:1 n=1 Tax=Cetraspora pellucida TaxID=1433469 RepID=A0ACA9M9L3_9GLOM|nr:4678_t:CDS:2 [Cetraspora pellucida]